MEIDIKKNAKKEINKIKKFWKGKFLGGDCGIQIERSFKGKSEYEK